MRDLSLLDERQEKEIRLRNYLCDNNLDAVVIGRQSNFAWLSAGGRNYVMAASDFGAACTVITKDKKYLVANTMDGERILTEELTNSGYELINLKWFEKSIDETVSSLISGFKTISDIPISGATLDSNALFNLHYPLSSYEIDRYRTTAALAENIIRVIADQVKPGMTEKDVEVMLCEEYVRNGFFETVILIGSDERIEKYRHPVPTDKKIKNTLLLAPSPRKNGLFSPISRMVYFGDAVPAELRKKYDTLLDMEAQVMACCQPGETFSKINDFEKSLYKKSPYPDEWQNHFMGGLTGYVPNEPGQYRDPLAKVRPFQTFNWYLTVSGAKVEEILLTKETGNEIISTGGVWPLKTMEVEGNIYALPDILLKY